MFLLFLDLSKAFDFIVREFAIGAQQGTGGSAKDAADAVAKLGLDQEEARQLALEIQQHGSYLEMCGADPKVAKLVAALHTGSWFQIGELMEVLVSAKGGRQGCKLGAIIFNFVYARALMRVEKRLKDEAILLQLPCCVDRPPWFEASAAAEGVHLQDVADTTYVDDELLMLAADTPDALDQKIDKLLEILCTVFSAFKLTINWAKGKTEAILVYKGPNASKHWRERFIDGVPIIRVRDGSKLHIVQHYKHVGSIVTANSNMAPDAQLRARSALAAWYKLAANVFGSEHLSIATKTSLAHSLIFSRLFYACETWPEVQPPVLRILEAVQTRVARRILDSWNTAKPDVSTGVVPLHTTNVELRRRLRWPSVECELRRRRLKHLLRLCRYAPRSLLAMLQAKVRGRRLPWITTVLRDIAEMRRFYGQKLLELAEPCADPMLWMRFILCNPGAWGQYIDGYIFHESTAPVARHEPIFMQPQGMGQTTEQGWLVCERCPEHARRIFPTARSLRAHVVAMHHHRAIAREYVGASGICPVCKLCFHTRLRAVAHIQRAGSRCATLLHECTQLHPDEVAALDEADRSAVRAAVRAGHARPLATRPGPFKGPKKTS